MFTFRLLIILFNSCQVDSTQPLNFSLPDAVAPLPNAVALFGKIGTQGLQIIAIFLQLLLQVVLRICRVCQSIRSFSRRSRMVCASCSAPLRLRSKSRRSDQRPVYDGPRPSRSPPPDGDRASPQFHLQIIHRLIAFGQRQLQLLSLTARSTWDSMRASPVAENHDGCPGSVCAAPTDGAHLCRCVPSPAAGQGCSNLLPFILQRARSPSSCHPVEASCNISRDSESFSCS